MINNINLLSIAPMMDRTDLHYRNLLRLISKNTLLYTEMINTNAIIHDQNNRFSIESDCNGPVALQIGCSDPASAAKAAKIFSKSLKTFCHFGTIPGLVNL